MNWSFNIGHANITLLRFSFSRKLTSYVYIMGSTVPGSTCLCLGKLSLHFLQFMPQTLFLRASFHSKVLRYPAIELPCNWHDLLIQIERFVTSIELGLRLLQR